MPNRSTPPRTPHRLPGARNPEIRKGIENGYSFLGYHLQKNNHRTIGFSRPLEKPMIRTRIQTLKPAWSENPESHSICIGPTGAGKGRSSLIPKLLTWRGSAVVIDPKGEAAAVTGRYRKETLKQEVIYVDPFGVLPHVKSDQLNPLDTRKLSGDNIENFSLGVPDLLHPDHQKSGKDVFWDNKADELISAVACAVLAIFPKPSRTIGKICDLLYSEDVVYGFSVFLDKHKNELPKMAMHGIANFISAPDATRGSILSVAQQHFKLFMDPTVRKGLEKTSFSLQNFKDGKPMTIFLILPPSKLKSHGVLLRIWLTCLLRISMDRKSLLQHRTYFMVDELANIGSIEEIDTAYTLLRSYSVKLCIYLQDLQQLKTLYPNSWNTLVGNSGTLQIFTPAYHITARELALLFGKDIDAEKMLRLPLENQILLSRGGQWIMSRKLDYLKDSYFKGKFDNYQLHHHRQLN